MRVGMGSSETSLIELTSALEALDAAFVCSGTWRGREPLALVLPSGERLVLGKKGEQQQFVRSLLDRSEPAPFGDRKGTRTDPRVRHALRVFGRDKIVVEGFDPRTSGVLDIVERELSPYGALSASLTDVVIYPEGGHFAVHKDTPRNEQMLGTLVVGLPVPHEGGTLELRHGGLEVALDWSKSHSDPMALSWAAFYGDVDHYVLPVTHGTRITLTYQVTVDRERWTGSETPKATTFRRALERAVGEGALSKGGRLFIPCAHMVIAGRHEKAGQPGQPVPVSSLRGRDRHLAAIFTELGLQAAVTPCLAIVNPPDEKWLPAYPLRDAERMALERPFSPRSKEALGGWVVLEGGATGEDGEPFDAFSLERFNPEAIEEDSYVTRDAAHAEFLAHSEGYSSTGYFGNEFGEALFYTFAAIEVFAPMTATDPLCRPNEEKRVSHPKFGEGIVTGERTSEGTTVLEIQFEDGAKRKLDAAFVKRLA